MRRFRTIPAAFLLMVFIGMLMVSSAAARTANLDIRSGEHSGYSRLVFDWDKMIAYSVKRDGANVTVTFQAGPENKVTMPGVGRLSRIGNARIVEQSTTKTVVVLTVSSKAAIKDYRVVRRIVFDVSGPPARAASSLSATQTKDTSQKTPVRDAALPQVKPDSLQRAAPQAPEKGAPQEENLVQRLKDAAAQLNAPEEAQKETPVSEKPLPKDVSVAESAQDKQKTSVATPPPPPSTLGASDNNAPTIITLATIEPTELAVFERFGTLWVTVADRQGTIEPERFGPLSDVLGAPRSVPMQGGGMAYGFQAPEKVFISVRKENLAWQIVFTNTHQADFSGIDLQAHFDDGAPYITADMRGNTKLSMTDPVTGEDITVVPTAKLTSKIKNARVTPDITVLPSYLGFAAVPHRDTVDVEIGDNALRVTAPNGLNMAPPSVRSTSGRGIEKNQSSPAREGRLFNFRAWQRGGLDEFAENRQDMVNRIAIMDDGPARTQSLFNLGLMYLGNGFGDEALGIMELVAEQDPELAKRSSFLAVRGAAKAIAGRFDGAIDDLGAPALQTNAEAQMWRGFAAAAAEQWRMAERLFPQDSHLLEGYPPDLAIPMTLYMAESALRSANTRRAAQLLETLEVFSESLPVRHQAAVHYLRGEMYRQNAQEEKALEEWDAAIKYRDRLYQTKARLAKALLEWQSERITAEEALKTLEHMRFAWREDGLETQILHSIGLLRVVNGKYYEGLSQLQDAIRLAKGNREDTGPITNDMLRIFRELFVDGKADTIPRLEAVTIFNEFQELMPSGNDAITAIETVSGYLVQMDLLGRAADMLENTLKDRGINKTDAARLGGQLASIYLLDDQPNAAISALQRTSRADLPADRATERELLRARALSQLDMTDQAIAALSDQQTRVAQSLRADIYWRAGDWENAANALMRLLPRDDLENITRTEAEYVLNTAVALKLAGDTDRLQDFKNRYDNLMQNTQLGPSFSVVSRAASVGGLQDRQTMLNIAAEVDIFKDFLGSYHSGNAKENNSDTPGETAD